MNLIRKNAIWSGFLILLGKQHLIVDSVLGIVTRAHILMTKSSGIFINQVIDFFPSYAFIPGLVYVNFNEKFHKY